MASLQDDFWLAIFHAGSDDAHSAAFHSSPIASCFLELEKVNQDLESKLRDDFRNILSSMDRLSLSPPHPSSSPPNPSTRTTSSIHNFPFTIAAYSWLLENVANPYPSSVVKASFAQQYSSPLSVVNSWFVNARRRIGWTALCRDYFNNCRTDTLDAAHRALVNENPRRPLAPDVIHAFVRVKVAAEDLYSSTFTRSTLTNDLDDVVRDVLDQDVGLVDGQDRHASNREVVVKPLEAPVVESRVKASYYYSSSDFSCSSSPVPPLDESLTDDSEEEEEVSPPILAGRKRRLSCSESTTLPTKRKRNQCLSSPVETCELASEEHVEKSCLRPITQTSSMSTPASHKRSLSSSTDPTGIPKCPPALTAEPCLHVVSNPLPSPTLESDHIIDEWFNANFDDLFSLPPPVDTIGLDVSAQWEVELFNNYSIPQEPRPQKQPFRSFNSSTEDPASTSVDLSSLDDLLQSFESGGFFPPTEITSSVTKIPAPDVPSSEFIDWTALLNTQTCEPVLDSILDPSCIDLPPLSVIDLPILQLP